MLATAVLAGFGFVFWLITARLFSEEDIGLATALISVMSLIGALSSIGFNAAFIRFLPSSTHKSDELNTGMILVGCTTALLSLGFVALSGVLSPRLSFIVSPFIASAFVIFCVTSSLNTLTNAVFLAGRNTKFTFIINSVFSAIKIALPFAFIGWGAFGIFTAAAIAQTAGFLLSVGVMMWKFDYTPALVIAGSVLRRVWRYCMGNYAASVLNLLPVTVLPLIITNHLGPASTAYYYISMMIGNMLYMIPWSMTSSLFAEGSNDEKMLNAHLKKALGGISLLLIPSIVVLLVISETLLHFFGETYADGGVAFLRLVALAGIPVGIYAIFGSLFQIRKNTFSLLVMNVCYMGSTLVLSFLLLSYGLIGIGVAWIAGNGIAAVVGYILYRWSPYLLKKIKGVTYVPRIILFAKLHYLRALLRNGFARKVILFYPEKPRWFHFLHTACHELGITMTNNPNRAFDRVVRFEDTTFGTDDPLFSELAKKHKVVNIDCTDISKANVEKVLQEVFGYGMRVDPQTHQGECVRKSDKNGVHDGKVIQCPTEPEEGYIYQKLINNQYDNSAMDLRVPIFNNHIPFILHRYKNILDRFDVTHHAVMLETHEDLNPEEIKKILLFCRTLGLDCGELDMLRDRDDKRLYIVDVNNTPGGACVANAMDKEKYAAYMETMSRSFEKEFLLATS